MDEERVRQRLQTMEEAIRELESYEVDAGELRSDLGARWRVEHGLQAGAQPGGE